VENTSGRTVERIEVGKQTVQIANEGRPEDLVEFADVTGDGRNEIIWASRSGGQENASDRLYCMGGGADTTRWMLSLHFETSFAQTEVPGNEFTPVDLKVGDLDADGTSELYAALRHKPYFPGLLLKLDPKTGTERARYLHAGHFLYGRFEVANLDADEAKEILIGAHNNAYDAPVLTVLDARRIQCHRPVRGKYSVEGIQPAQHDAYIRFPSSPVGQEAPQMHPSVRFIKAEPQEKIITAEVEEGKGKDPPFLLASFSYNLEPVGVGTSSQYDRLAERLVHAGRLETVPGPADFRRYQQQIQYWMGTGWTTQPGDRQ
jgi:hypothetical protein